MQTGGHTAQKAPETFQRAYDGIPSEIRQVRADLAATAAGCPAAEELVLLGSELATNAVMQGAGMLVGSLASH
jgi:Pyruvate/2-oxoacid:ferredoxin oxidoreductase gamma subunit